MPARNRERTGHVYLQQKSGLLDFRREQSCGDTPLAAGQYSTPGLAVMPWSKWWRIFFISVT